MASMRNKELVRTYFEKAFAQCDLDGASEFLSDNYMLHDPMRPDFAGGRDAFKQIHSVYMRGIRNHSFTIDDQIAEDDRVATRWTVSACQSREVDDLPAKDECYKVSGITVSRVSDGKIVEEWQDWDALGMLKQRARHS